MVYVITLISFALPMALCWWLAEKGRFIWLGVPAVLFVGLWVWAAIQARSLPGFDGMAYALLIGLVAMPALLGEFCGIVLGVFRRRARLAGEKL